MDWANPRTVLPSRYRTSHLAPRCKAPGPVALLHPSFSLPHHPLPILRLSCSPRSSLVHPSLKFLFPRPLLLGLCLSSLKLLLFSFFLSLASRSTPHSRSTRLSGCLQSHRDGSRRVLRNLKSLDCVPNAPSNPANTAYPTFRPSLCPSGYIAFTSRCRARPLLLTAPVPQRPKLSFRRLRLLPPSDRSSIILPHETVGGGPGSQRFPPVSLARILKGVVMLQRSRR